MGAYLLKSKIAAFLLSASPSVFCYVFWREEPFSQIFMTFMHVIL